MDKVDKVKILYALDFLMVLDVWEDGVILSASHIQSTIFYQELLKEKKQYSTERK